MSKYFNNFSEFLHGATAEDFANLKSEFLQHKHEYLNDVEKSVFLKDFGFIAPMSEIEEALIKNGYIEPIKKAHEKEKDSIFERAEDVAKTFKFNNSDDLLDIDYDDISISDEEYDEVLGREDDEPSDDDIPESVIFDVEDTDENLKGKDVKKKKRPVTQEQTFENIGFFPMAYTEQIQSAPVFAEQTFAEQAAPEIPVEQPSEPVFTTFEANGIHQSYTSSDFSAVDEGFSVNDFGRLQSEAQQLYHDELVANRTIGQDTRDLQYAIDNYASYGWGGTSSPSVENMLLPGEAFNQVFLENFSDATAVEFSTIPVPENVQAIDLSAAGDGSVVGYQSFGTLYITSAPSQSFDEPNAEFNPSIYLNPDSSMMFQGSSALTSVSFSSDIVHAENVHNMGAMYLGCENLISVDMSGLYTGELRNIDGMFAGCNNLLNFNSEGWTTQNIETAKFTFSECHQLTQDPSAEWRMGNLRYADGFMSGCLNIRDVDMSNWGAHELVSTTKMFFDCESAENILVGGLVSPHNQDMSEMFYNCKDLSGIELNELISVASAAPEGTVFQDMLTGCNKLIGQEGFVEKVNSWMDTVYVVNSQTNHNNSSFDFPTESIPVHISLNSSNNGSFQATSYYNFDGSQTFIVPNLDSNGEISNGFSATIQVKPDADSGISVITTKTFDDNTRAIQTETFYGDGKAFKETVLYNENGKELQDISQEKLKTLDSLKSIERKQDENGNNVVVGVPLINGAKFESISSFEKNGEVSSKSVVIESNGKSISVPSLAQAYIDAKSNFENANNTDIQNKFKRSAGTPFGDSSSSAARTIYDAAAFKANKAAYDAKKEAEVVSDKIKGFERTIRDAVDSLVKQGLNPKTEGEKEVDDLMGKTKGVAKDTLDAALSLSAFSAFLYEGSEFREIMKSTHALDSVLSREGIKGNPAFDFSSLKDKSYKEAVSQLKELKDTNGKQLLSNTEIKSIAKHRAGVNEMLDFKNTITDRASILDGVSTKNLSKSQLESLEKFRNDKFSKLTEKDIQNLTEVYFRSNKASVLYGKGVGSFNRKELEEIIAGKNPHIPKESLALADKKILAANLRSKNIGKALNLKALTSRGFNELVKILNKSGGIASESGQMVSNINRTTKIVITGTKTAFTVGSIYGRIGLKVGKSVTYVPRKIIVRVGGKAVTAVGAEIGKTAIAQSLAAQRRLARQSIVQAKQVAAQKATQTVARARDAIASAEPVKRAARKVAKKQADRLAKKASRRATMARLRQTLGRRALVIRNNRAVQALMTGAGHVGKILSLPFAGLGFLGKGITIVVNAIKGVLAKVAASLSGILLVYLIIYMITLTIMGITMGITTLNLTTATSVMSPPVEDVFGNVLSTSNEDYEKKWENLKEIIQDKYAQGQAVEKGVISSVNGIFNEGPDGVIGWNNEPILEYGVPADKGENDGIWIAYEPKSDDNAKDAIVLAYIIMGSKDFYYDAESRNALISDLLGIMNPGIDDEDITNTIYPKATYGDDDRKIYACQTGCDKLTYYCGNKSIVNSFSKTGCDSKTASFKGDVSVNELDKNVRLSTDGQTVVANEESTPSVGKPVLYADNLENHPYGDYYISTCNGDEYITIGYKYLHVSSTPSLRPATSANEYKSHKGYHSYKYFPNGGCGSHSYGEHWHFYRSQSAYNNDNYAEAPTRRGMLIQESIPTTEIKTNYFKVKLSDFGKFHTPTTYSNDGKGVDTQSEIVGPSGLSISSAAAKDYIFYHETTDVTEAWIESASETCASWDVTFYCSGHTINTCPNGHTDLGVTIRQYGAEDIDFYGSGSGIKLPTNEPYAHYIKTYFEENELDSSFLEVARELINGDWDVLYGVANEDTLTTVENAHINEAYLYHFFTNSDDNNLGYNNAQAAAFLALIKETSNFKINKLSADEKYFGLLQWDEDELAIIGKNLTYDQPTCMEQMDLLKIQLGDVGLSGGFKGANYLVEFRDCRDSVEGVEKAVELIVNYWDCGNYFGSVEAVKQSALKYYEDMSSPDSQYNKSNLGVISAYVEWALRTAASPEHGYCQGKHCSVGDYNCGSFCKAAVENASNGDIPHWHNNPQFEVFQVGDNFTLDDLEFGDLIYISAATSGGSEHIEIYLGQGSSVGARGADGKLGCAKGDEYWAKHESAWQDHVFHMAGDQGAGWTSGEYTYTEISVSKLGNFEKYETVYRLRENYLDYK